MWHRRAIVAMFLAVGWTGGLSAAAGPARTVPTEPVELKVRVYAEAGVPWLAAAQAVVERILAAASIRLAWIDCPVDSTCGVLPAPNELIVRFVSRRPDPASHGCGVALRPDTVPGRYITLFVDCVREGAETFRVAEAIVAAYCLAHEIGHLLLPTSAHAPIGIMRARPDQFDWQRGARQALQFRPSEQRQIYEGARRRAAAVR